MVLRPVLDADLPRIAALARWVWLDSYAKDGVSDAYAGYVDQAFDPRHLQGPMWLVEQGQPSEPSEPGERGETGKRGETDKRGAQHLLAWAHVDVSALCPVPDRGPSVELGRLYVAPPHQGLGLGRQLLKQVREAFADQSVWLRAWEGNAGALRFYRREGAALWGEAWFELDGQRHRNEVLGWPALRTSKKASLG